MDLLSKELYHSQPKMQVLTGKNFSGLKFPPKKSMDAKKAFFFSGPPSQK